MKHFFNIFIILFVLQMGHSQQNDTSYEVLWKQVTKLESEALTKSALKVVRDISEKAKNEQNTSQIVKSLLFTSKYALILEEDAQLNIVHDFIDAIENNKFPVKNILESYLGNLYWQYFQENRYQFYERTTTEAKVDSVDFRTWDLTTLFKEIAIHFEKSLASPSELQKVKASEFDVLLHQEKDSELFRPTLYDLLAHTALGFYTTSENSIERPADKFEIDDPEYLCEALAFSKITLDTTDINALQAKALGVYQGLLLFHLMHKSIEALVDVDTERLTFIYENAMFLNKDALYEEVLQNSFENYKDDPLSGLYLYEIAQLYYQQGNSYDPKTHPSTQWKRKAALDLCETVIKKYPESRATAKCKALRSTIWSKSMQLTSENHIPIDKPARLLVTYKNYDSLRLKAYKISQTQLLRLNGIYPEAKQLAFIQNLPVSKQWDTNLKNENDYQTHSTEILLPELEGGSYVILGQPTEKEDSSFAFSPIQVTNIALVETRTAKYHQFQAINRTNGQPLKKAKVVLTYLKNYERPALTNTYFTDERGMVKIQTGNHNWASISAKITFEEESATFGDYYISRKYTNGNLPDNQHKGFLFTDRSIYRPGQPLYFKGISITGNKEITSVLPNIQLSVILRDVNYQIVAEQDFTTNEYGSFSGEFILPNSGLTGNYTLEANSKSLALSTSTSISVEEYKRPKFETSFDPVTDTFKVNDSITVTGKAMAYAGSPITDAKVSYTVQRLVSFPGWYYWSRPYFNSTPQQIARGETATNGSGQYAITFKAIPDSGMKKENLPVFNYELTTDVTDINGETRSTTTLVRVGYHALTANILVPEDIAVDEKNINITVNTENLNGESVPSKGILKIYKLVPPSEVLRSRPWETPDYQGWTYSEFKELFPYDAYKNEQQPEHWDKGPLVWEASFNTGQSTDLLIKNLNNWDEGKYVIELDTKDRFGQLVQEKKIITLYNEQAKTISDNQLFEIRTDKNAYETGEEVKITLLSAAKNVWVTLFVEKDTKIMDTRVLQLNNDAKSITVPVTAEDLGGFAVNYSYSFYNDYISGSVPIAVPYPASDLQIETVTFRDKLLPAQEESWTFKIKGPKGDQVAAEILASMYDASLDAFKDHTWYFSPLYRGNYYSNIRSSAYRSYGTLAFRTYQFQTNGYSYTPQYYDSFNWFGLQFGYGPITVRGMRSKEGNVGVLNEMVDEAESEETVMQSVAQPMTDMEGDLDPPALAKENEQKDITPGSIQIRKNLKETAFFYPQLRTDAVGNVSFEFTAPEALTRWKLQLLAHTKTLQSKVHSLDLVTQKELMVIPNVPRFLREGDEITISTKITNLTEKSLTGEAILELADALTGKNISKKLLIIPPPNGGGAAGRGGKTRSDKGGQSFKVDSLGNTQVSWTLKIPTDLQAVQYTVSAKAGDFSDGEQNVLPVLTNRILVTETLPMWVRSKQTKTFVMEKLKDNTSTTLKHHKLTLEITSNPAWYAVQALPYLMEYPYECNEQTFARYYANTLAGHIANSNPRIREVFDQWANSDALLSDLEKNQELKSLLIEETPWLRDAQSETEQKKRIALLFELNKLKNERTASLGKLKNNQMSSGAWAWFRGGRENRYITQHIIAGLGHLNKLGVQNAPSDIESMTTRAISYLDAEFIKEYEEMKKYAKNLQEDHLSATQIHYLYMRSFFPKISTSKKVEAIIAYYKEQAQKYWTRQGLYSKGMLALILHRMEDTNTSMKIIRSLEENSVTSDELGMYWKENTNSWLWYRAPVETQALLIEAFSEIQEDTETVDNLKIWLLKNKQTNQWKTTKATTEAVYALLLQGSDWLSVTEAIDVMVGSEPIPVSKLENVRVEAGTGYFKTTWEGNEIGPQMADVQLSKKGEGIAWGAMYWQYFEDLDKITSAETPLQLKKKLFIKKNTDSGEQISEITKDAKLKVCDLVRIRIELRADRPMEYIHMKDMRAAGFEPINVLSSYKWQDGLGYYESTKDASTNFFFDYLPKGVYVFEYDLRVNNSGEFSNGITTIQSMYAPEFSSHSEGVRVTVDN